MKIPGTKIAVLALGVIALLAVAALDSAIGKDLANRSRASAEQRRGSQIKDKPIKEKVNAWTIGLAGGLLEGAPIRFATEIARVTDDGENLHVLPIVTRGPTENIEDLLYLRGVDAAIINADVLEEFKKVVPNVQQKISYILNLFPSELHVFVRPEIRSIQDLAGKRVNFNTPGTAAAYSGPLIFERLKINVDKLFIPHQTALEQLRKGEISAVVFITSKPVDAATDRPRRADSNLVDSDGSGRVQLSSGLRSLSAPGPADHALVRACREAARARLPSQVEGGESERNGSGPQPLQRGAGVA
jgi:TRAP-type uncharacterized transport system substrate-binding protein